MSAQQVKIIYGRITNEYLHPLLEAHGYKQGARGRYFKSEGDVEFRVSTSLLRRGRQPDAHMEAAASVAFKRIWAFIKGCEVFAETDLHSATGCGGRINMMLPRTVHPCWNHLDEMSDSEALGEEIIEQFDRFVFPFLDRYGILDHAIDYWERSRSFEALARCGAILLRGERELAFAELDKLILWADEQAEELRRPGELQRAADFRRFREFLQTAGYQGQSVRLAR